jgi:hypothetical protein
MINEDRPTLGFNAVSKRENWFGARPALLPIPSGLLAALGGRNRHRQRPASGSVR